MSAANSPRPEREDDFFDEPDYDKFSDEELDALACGESLDALKSKSKKAANSTEKTIRASQPVDEDLEPEEIDPALEAELREQFDADSVDVDSFDSDEDWDDAANDELGDL